MHLRFFNALSLQIHNCDFVRNEDFRNTLYLYKINQNEQESNSNDFRRLGKIARP